MRQDHRSDILFAVALLLALVVAWRVVDVLMLVYVSALFAVVLAPAIDLIRRLRIGRWSPSRGVAVLLLIAGVLGALILFLDLAVPPIYRDARELAENWPQRMAALSQRIQSLPFLENFDPSRIQEYAGEVIGGVFGLFKGVAGGVFGVFSWIIITTYFILDGERAFHWALSMVPRPQRLRLESTLIRAERRMRHWLVGQFILMLTLGSLSFIVFGLLKIKYFYALAVFAGLANIVPIIGPIAAVTVASLIALVDGPAKVLGVLIFFTVYQQLETGFLTPRVMRSTVDLPPLAVIISLSLGGSLAGVLGALVAVPTAALCAVIVDEYLVKHDAPAPPPPAPAVT
jgi:predicted PurR-regulated permease PerM